MTTVAFIGLGNMGGPMAANLAKAGFNVRAFDLSAQALETAKSQGCEIAATASEAATDADFVISMLPAGKHVRGLYVDGDAPLFEVIKPSALVIDCSTIDADTARQVAAAGAEKGIGFVDAPVSGGVGGAQAGTLTFIVGGSEAQFAQAQPVLQAMGKNIFHAGDHGAGQVAKVCNNMLLSILMAGTCEAINMGVKNGLDPAVLSEIMKQSSGGNWALNVYNPYPGDGKRPRLERLPGRLPGGSNDQRLRPRHGREPAKRIPRAHGLRRPFVVHPAQSRRQRQTRLLQPAQVVSG